MAYFFWSPAAIQAFEKILEEEGILQSRLAGFHGALGQMVRAGYVAHGRHPTEIADCKQAASTILSTEKGRAAYAAYRRNAA